MLLKILFDTDPGVDDALALLLALASPEIELLSVTTVFGNHGVERVRLHVETEGRCAGKTVADRRRQNQWPGLPEVDVCVGVDSERLLALFRERIVG